MITKKVWIITHATEGGITALKDTEKEARELLRELKFFHPIKCRGLIIKPWTIYEPKSIDTFLCKQSAY